MCCIQANTATRESTDKVGTFLAAEVASPEPSLSKMFHHMRKQTPVFARYTELSSLLVAQTIMN
jgi:hypothetical protein